MCVTNADLAKLALPFPCGDVDWKIQTCGKSRNGTFWGLCVAYLDNRAMMDRLDEVCGPSNWWNEYRPGPLGGVLCGLSIRTEEGVVTKWDGAENTEIEAVKGGLSDSMKRCAVHWGIGRYLYNLGETWAQIVDQNAQGARRAKTSAKDGAEQFFWLPPRLPEWALPPAKQPEQPKAPPKNGNGAKAPPAKKEHSGDPHESNKSAVSNCEKERFGTLVDQIAKGTRSTPEQKDELLDLLAQRITNSLDDGNPESVVNGLLAKILHIRKELSHTFA